MIATRPRFSGGLIPPNPVSVLRRHLRQVKSRRALLRAGDARAARAAHSSSARPGRRSRRMRAGRGRASHTRGRGGRRGDWVYKAPDVGRSTSHWLVLRLQLGPPALFPCLVLASAAFHGARRAWVSSEVYLEYQPSDTAQQQRTTHLAPLASTASLSL
eukprot:scaffold2639_cov385-Prasinococcus_capsulatus_cf.AAC.1